MRVLKVKVFDELGNDTAIKQNRHLLFLLETLGADIVSVIETTKLWELDPTILNGYNKILVYNVPSASEEPVQSLLSLVTSIQSQIRYQWED